MSFKRCINTFKAILVFLLNRHYLIFKPCTCTKELHRMLTQMFNIHVRSPFFQYSLSRLDLAYQTNKGQTQVESPFFGNKHIHFLQEP